MEPAQDSAPRSSRRLLGSRWLWACVVVFLSLATLHYLTPQARLLSPALSWFLTRHAVERIVFVLPVALATQALGLRGGLLTSALSVLVMLPRAIWISAYPADALFETIAAGLVGCLVSWMIGVQQRARRLHERAASRLSAIHAVTAAVSRSLDLEQVLDAALEEILHVTGFDAGLVYVVNNRSQELVLTAARGFEAARLAALRRIKVGESAYGRSALSGGPVPVTERAPSRATVEEAGLPAQFAVPLRSKGQLRGVLVLASRGARDLAREEAELLTAVGNEIGVAVENARLYERMRYYARQMLQAQERERQRIARELHDETLQELVVLSRHVDALMTPAQRTCEVPVERLSALQALIHDLSAGMRRFVQDLRPSTLDHLGLVPALRQLVADLGSDGALAVELAVVGQAERLQPDQELALFRVAQEALSNVRRHAHASRVDVRLSFDAAGVRMAITDDGDGFAVPEAVDDYVATGRLGLAGMDERARIVGGTFEIRSGEGAGTTVLVTVPPSPGAPAAEVDAVPVR